MVQLPTTVLQAAEITWAQEEVLTSIAPKLQKKMLKAFVSDYTPVYSVLPVPVILDATEVQPEQILDQRHVTKGKAALVQVKIKWTSHQNRDTDL
ncbi:hypothetical protein E2562_024182 [Oryza meyeriana var. granulata]|uniref:Uncharacterized protein n=1 Tax=Oryza meyeriana var. granulata TaxID=110450 RepID=A0A6G1BZB9_9ORYZ|nr:hypothetical protein E2562_024182 [Oryza meyeriana var. granulata]